MHRSALVALGVAERACPVRREVEKVLRQLVHDPLAKDVLPGPLLANGRTHPAVGLDLEVARSTSPIFREEGSLELAKISYSVRHRAMIARDRRLTPLRSVENSVAGPAHAASFLLGVRPAERDAYAAARAHRGRPHMPPVARAVRAPSSWLALVPMTALLRAGPGPGSINGMDMSQVWPRLATSTQTWLIAHNGEPLPDDILDEILTVTAGQRDPRWWAGGSHEGETQLTDEAVGWIDETANRE